MSSAVGSLSETLGFVQLPEDTKPQLVAKLTSSVNELAQSQLSQAVNWLLVYRFINSTFPRECRAALREQPTLTSILRRPATAKNAGRDTYNEFLELYWVVFSRNLADAATQSLEPPDARQLEREKELLSPTPPESSTSTPGPGPGGYLLETRSRHPTDKASGLSELVSFSRSSRLEQPLTAYLQSPPFSNSSQSPFSVADDVSSTFTLLSAEGVDDPKISGYRGSLDPGVYPAGATSSSLEVVQRGVSPRVSRSPSRVSRLMKDAVESRVPAGGHNERAKELYFRGLLSESMASATERTKAAFGTRTKASNNDDLVTANSTSLSSMLFRNSSTGLSRSFSARLGAKPGSRQITKGPHRSPVKASTRPISLAAALAVPEEMAKSESFRRLRLIFK